jgi:hypothetical protein
MAPTLENYLMRRLKIKYGAARDLALSGRVLLGMEKDDPATVALRRECLSIYAVSPVEYEEEDVVDSGHSNCTVMYSTRAEILEIHQRPVSEIVHDYEEIIGPIHQRQQEEQARASRLTKDEEIIGPIQQEEQARAPPLTKEQAQECTTGTFDETASSTSSTCSEESVSSSSSEESAESGSSQDEIDPASGEKEVEVSLPDESSCLEESSEASGSELCGIDHTQLSGLSQQRRKMVLAYEEMYGPIQGRKEQYTDAPIVIKIKRNLETELDATEESTETETETEGAVDEIVFRELPRTITLDPKLLVKELKQQVEREKELRKRENKLKEILARVSKKT